MALELLEERRALAVTAPTIRLAVASDTGAKGDGITRIARPVFTGQAAPGASVAVAVSGNPSPLGVAKANLKGAWSLATPVDRTFSPGDFIISATAVDTVKNQQSRPTPVWIRVDPTPPVVMGLSYGYDPTTGVGVATLTFSKPVTGVTQASLRLVGTTNERVAINVALSDPAIGPYVGRVSLTASPGGTTYTFREGIRLAEPGNYRLQLVAKGSGITDMAGNPLVRGAFCDPISVA